MIICSMVLPAL